MLIEGLNLYVQTSLIYSKIIYILKKETWGLYLYLHLKL